MKTYMGRIDWDEFWDDIALGSSDYYEQKKRFKGLSFNNYYNKVIEAFFVF